MAIQEVRGLESSLVGELVITSVERGFTLIQEPLRAFLLAHPNLSVRFVTDVSKQRLEYGDAHIAIRPGPEPTEPDYVVSRHCDIKLGLYAIQSYIAKNGLPESEDDFGQHKFAVAKLPV